MYLWLGFGRHNQGRKIAENILKTSVKINRRVPDSFDFAHDVSSVEVELQHMKKFETVSVDIHSVVCVE